MSAIEPAPASDERLVNRLEFETLISDLSSRFINLPSSEVDRGIEDALRSVSEFLSLDFAIIWQWSAAAPGVLTPTHAYLGGGGPRPSEPMTQDQYEYPWVVQEMVAGRTVIVPNLDALPEEAAVDRESALRYGIKSNLTLPLSLAGEPAVGVLGLNTVQSERDWPDVLVQRLQLVGQVFTNALARSRREEEKQRSAARLAAGAELAGLAFYEVDLGKGVAYFDGRLRDLVGLPRTGSRASGPWSSGWNICIRMTASVCWTLAGSCTKACARRSRSSIASCILRRGRSGFITWPALPGAVQTDMRSPRTGSSVTSASATMSRKRPGRIEPRSRTSPAWPLQESFPDLSRTSSTSRSERS